MDYSQFLAMKQEIGLLAVFLIVFLYDTFAPKRSLGALGAISCILFAAVTALGFTSILGAKTDIIAFQGMYYTGPVYSTIKNILNVGTLIVMIQSLHWINQDATVIRRGEFFELLIVTLFGMNLMISSGHLLVFVLGLETASLPLAALVAFDKHRYESREAAIKYILTALFSTAVLMMGISYVYGLTGSLYYGEIGSRLYANGAFNYMLIVSIAFVMAGIGFKLSLVPFHLWTADVYQGAPTPVTAYLSVISKGSAAFAFLVILWNIFGPYYNAAWEWMLYALIIVTITVGNLFAIRQKNMKRFLAFSSVSQAGYIMLGIIAFNSMGVSALMYYILVYVISNLAAFGVIGAIENHTGFISMEDYRGLSKTNPRLSFCMMLAMFSLAGIPPFAGFFSKFFIFTSAINQGSVAIYVLVLIALINTIISLYYYLLVVKAMYISDEHPVVPRFRTAPAQSLSLVICLAGILLLGIVSTVYNNLLTIVG